MYDPKFEKTVQQKMEELEFRPSESVWVNIEKTVSGERRRRGIPFFWRLIVPALLLSAVGGGYYFGEKAGRKAATPAVVVATKPDGISAEKVLQTAKERTETPVAANAARPVVVAATKKATANNKMTIKTAKGQGVAKPTASGVGEEIPVSAGAVETAQNEQRGNTASRRTDAWYYRPGLANQRLSHGVSAAALRTNRGLINLNSLSRVKRPWEAGFIAGAGIDRLNRVNSGQANNPVSYTASSFFNLSRASVSKASVSDMRPDASFYAGIYLQKGISDRWTFHTGLDLHYFSTRMSVGQPMNIVASPSASLLNLNAPLAATPAPVVYTVGTQETYTNRYYMLELPVTMQYRLNKSPLLPFFLEGGVSVSRLMGANALLYNPTTGLYLKDESALAKTQLNVRSALLVGLPFHGIRIQAGPEVQYGLTPLINTQGLGDQHFFYTGVRLVVLPGKR